VLRAVAPRPIEADASGSSSRDEIKSMMPVEMPIPTAMARAFSRTHRATATPIAVVNNDSRDSKNTAR
jgi:hypothetical protein